MTGEGRVRFEGDIQPGINECWMGDYGVADSKQ